MQRFESIVVFLLFLRFLLIEINITFQKIFSWHFLPAFFDFFLVRDWNFLEPNKQFSVSNYVSNPICNIFSYCSEKGYHGFHEILHIKYCYKSLLQPRKNISQNLHKPKDVNHNIQNTWIIFILLFQHTPCSKEWMQITFKTFSFYIQLPSGTMYVYFCI